jgi:hypothetical protein
MLHQVHVREYEYMCIRIHIRVCSCIICMHVYIPKRSAFPCVPTCVYMYAYVCTCMHIDLFRQKDVTARTWTCTALAYSCEIRTHVHMHAPTHALLLLTGACTTLSLPMGLRQNQLKRINCCRPPSLPPSLPPCAFLPSSQPRCLPPPPSRGVFPWLPRAVMRAYDNSSVT